METLPFQMNSQLVFKLPEETIQASCIFYTQQQITESKPLQYALTSLYHHILPEVPPEEILADIQLPSTYTILLLRSDDSVRKDFQLNKARILRKFQHEHNYKEGEVEFSEYSEDEENEKLTENDLFKAQDYLNNKTPAFSKVVKQKLPGLLSYVKSQQNNPKFKQSDLLNIDKFTPRLKDKLLAAITVENLQVNDPVQGQVKIAQCKYLGARMRFQLLKIGRRLVKTAIQQAYNDKMTSFFTFAGQDSVRFWRNCGLSDDAMLSGYFSSQLDDGWSDCVPMVLFLKGSEGVENLNINNIYQKWRSQAYQRYSEEANLIGQLCQKVQGLEEDKESQIKLKEEAIQQLALEKSRCVMYEQLVQQLENQLLGAGIKPNIDQNEVMNKVLSSVSGNNSDE